ncbi:MAG TPA: polysaccharide deacetylase family protein [Myxococcales bacterium]|nr:polysaccharide deacetylase family protein [Myxococcales bacterium]
MKGLKEQAWQVARRAAKSAAAVALHYTGAEDLIARVQRRAVGGVRVLIVSYHRVVGNLKLESERALPSLNIGRDTFRKHLEVLSETHEVVRLDDALEVLAGKRSARRDLAVITFDDGYRDVYDYAFPVLRELKLPAIAYVPSAFVGTQQRLAHDRLWQAFKTMERRRLGPMSVGVGGAYEGLLVRAFDGARAGTKVLERLIADNPTPVLYGLAEVLEERLRIDRTEAPRGQMPMTWEMLREMGAHGIETGAHTAEHTVLTNQALDEARREIAACKSTLEKGTGRPVRHFAYCNGWYSAGVAQALRAEGFVSAVTTEDIPNMPGVDPYALKRKVLWEMSSTGVFGGWSKALAACQFNDVFGMLALTKPVLGACPTRFGNTRPGDLPQTAHG